MILPVVAYGDPVLRKQGKEIDKDFPNLNELIENMKETMLHASGVGLAAPQVGHAIRLFIVDASPFADMEDMDEEEKNYLKDFKHIFINAKIIREEGEEWIFNEGCLSVPNINEDVLRKESVTLEYQDENFEKHTRNFGGLPARIILHEYDHTEGIIFTDKLSSLKKRLLKKKLNNISKGKVEVSYKMRYPKLKF
jgi:peptide deformylase